MTKNKIAHQAGSKLPRTSDENGIMYLQKDKKLVNRELFRIVIPHNPSKFRFQTLKNQTAKARSRKVLAAPGTSSYIPGTHLCSSRIYVSGLLLAAACPTLHPTPRAESTWNNPGDFRCPGEEHQSMWALPRMDLSHPVDAWNLGRKVLWLPKRHE